LKDEVRVGTLSSVKEYEELLVVTRRNNNFGARRTPQAMFENYLKGRVLGLDSDF
jgi:hypothetical protein